MKKTIKVFTLFSGYDSQWIALEELMVLNRKDPKCVFELVGWCEKDNAAIRSHNALFPEAKRCHYKDVTAIDWTKVADFDLLFYSSCCQSVSLTGAMEGMEKGSGTQSSLIWYALDAIRIKKPKYCILENVASMACKTFMPSFVEWMRAVDAQGYHSAAKKLHSADFGIPQNRERLFMVSIRDDIEQVFIFPQLMKNNSRSIEELFEKHVDEKYYHSHQEVVKYLLALAGKKIDKRLVNTDVPIGGVPIQQMASLTCMANGYQVIPTLKASSYGAGTYRNFCNTGHFPQVAVVEVWQKDTTAGISYKSIINKAEEKGYKVTNASRLAILHLAETLKPNQYIRLRNMTPREQFRFMGVPERYIDKLCTSGNPDCQLYKQAGNSIVVDVLVELFKSLFYPDQLASMQRASA